MPIQQMLGQGNAQVVELPDGGAQLVWGDQVGNVVVIPFDSEGRKAIGKAMIGMGLHVANGSELPKPG